MLSSRRIFFPYSRSWFTRIPYRAGPVIAIPKFWLNLLSRIPFSFLIPYPCPNFGESYFPGLGSTQIPYPVVVSRIPQSWFAWFNPKCQGVACDARTPTYSRKLSIQARITTYRNGDPLFVQLLLWRINKLQMTKSQFREKKMGLYDLKTRRQRERQKQQ